MMAEGSNVLRARPKTDPAMPGWVIDADGISHESMTEFLASAVGMCGCVEVEPVVARVRDALTLLEAQDFDGFCSLLKLDEDPATFYLVTELLEDHGLIDHGTSIRAPWITSDGKMWLTLALEVMPAT